MCAPQPTTCRSPPLPPPLGAHSRTDLGSLYQLFGDKDALLRALAVDAFDEYLAQKSTLGRSDDPVADMRRGWDTHVEFGVNHPALYVLMYGTDHPGRRPPAAEKAHEQLLAFLHDVADAGILRLPPDLAAQLLQAAVVGVTLALVGDRDTDPSISTTTREIIVAAITTARPAVSSPTTTHDLAPRALALDRALCAIDPDALALRPAETALLHDWLHRLAR